MIPDSYITESRLKALRELPWPIPAAILLEMPDEDLDRLTAASSEGYWRVLNGIVICIDGPTTNEETA